MYIFVTSRRDVLPSKMINFIILYTEGLNILPCIPIVLSVVWLVIEVIAFTYTPGEERRKQKRMVMEKIRLTCHEDLEETLKRVTKKTQKTSSCQIFLLSF